MVGVALLDAKRWQLCNEKSKMLHIKIVELMRYINKLAKFQSNKKPYKKLINAKKLQLYNLKGGVTSFKDKTETY